MMLEFNFWFLHKVLSGTKPQKWL